MRHYLAVLLVCCSLAPDALALDLIGYLPSYRMGSPYLQTQLGMLNEVRYFGLTAASDGSIVPLPSSGTMQSHLNNIAILKQKIEAMPVAQRPRLDITLGGAGQAASFSAIAGSSGLSATFAQNVNSLMNSTGATS